VRNVWKNTQASLRNGSQPRASDECENRCSDVNKFPRCIPDAHSSARGLARVHVNRGKMGQIGKLDRATRDGCRLATILARVPREYDELGRSANGGSAVASNVARNVEA